MTEFVAYNSRWRLGLMFIGAAAFAIAGLWLAGGFGEAPTSPRHSATVNILLGVLTMLLFGWCAYEAAKRFVDEDVRLRIGSFGIRWSPWSDQTIPWSEIVDVTTWNYKRQKFIVLHPKDPARFPGRGLAARIARIDRFFRPGHIAISLQGTDRSHDDAIRAIARYRAG